jgi:hypothetical protein
MKRYSLATLIIFALILFATHTNAQDDEKTLTAEQAKIMQKDLKKAMLALKREIKIEVKVENGGAITGTVKCKRVRYPENVVVYIEKIGDNKFPAPEEHGTVDQFNLTFVPHVCLY